MDFYSLLSMEYKYFRTVVIVSAFSSILRIDTFDHEKGEK